MSTIFVLFYKELFRRVFTTKCVANFKITCGYPALFFNIELVICGCVNGLTVGSKDIENERIWLEHIINSNQIH